MAGILGLVASKVAAGAAAAGKGAAAGAAAAGAGAAGGAAQAATAAPAMAATAAAPEALAGGAGALGATAGGGGLNFGELLTSKLNDVSQTGQTSISPADFGLDLGAFSNLQLPVGRRSNASQNVMADMMQSQGAFNFLDRMPF